MKLNKICIVTYYLPPTWSYSLKCVNFEYVVTSFTACEMKLLILSQTSVVQPFEVWEWISKFYWACYYPSMLGLKFIRVMGPGMRVYPINYAPYPIVLCLAVTIASKLGDLNYLLTHIFNVISLPLEQSCDGPFIVIEIIKLLETWVITTNRCYI